MTDGQERAVDRLVSHLDYIRQDARELSLEMPDVEKLNEAVRLISSAEEMLEKLLDECEEDDEDEEEDEEE